MADYIEDDDPLEGTEGAGLTRVARPPAETMPPVALRGLGPVSPSAAGSTEDLEARGVASHTGPRALVSTTPSPEPIGSTEDLENRGLESHVAPRPGATPSPLEQKTTADQSELSRLENTGSGISQVKNPFARGALRGLNTIGSILLPSAMSAIPGTEQHHQELIGQARGRIGEDLGEAKEQAGIEETAARTDQANAAGEKDRAAASAANQPKPKEESWKEFPQFTDTDGTPLKVEQNSGTVVRASDGKAPTGFKAAKQEAEDKTEKVTRVINGVPHEVLVNARTGEDIKDEGQTKVPGESPDQKRSAQESAQVEREARTNIRKAENGYRDTQKSVGQLKSAIDAASDGNGLLTSFVPTMEVLGINAANGVHRISPAEAQAAQLPGGWAEQFNAWLDKAGSGKVSPELKKEGKQLADVLLKTSYQRYKATYDDESGMVEGYGGKDFSKRVRVIPEGIADGSLGSSTTAKDYGPAPQGRAEGSTGTLPDGTKIVIKNGRIVEQ